VQQHFSRLDTDSMTHQSITSYTKLGQRWVKLQQMCASAYATMHAGVVYCQYRALHIYIANTLADNICSHACKGRDNVQMQKYDATQKSDNLCDFFGCFACSHGLPHPQPTAAHRRQGTHDFFAPFSHEAHGSLLRWMRVLAGDERRCHVLYIPFAQAGAPDSCCVAHL
jgi:hypothetical protein